MIPVKVLTTEQAELLGLRKSNKRSGQGLMGVGMVVSGQEGGEEKIMEKAIIEDNKKELIFMDPEREQELKSKKKFSEYIKQFDKIPRGLK